jgi:cytochrome c-type biogenesis protein CcmH/NrfF
MISKFFLTVGEMVQIHPHKKVGRNYTLVLWRIALVMVIILTFAAGYLAVKLEKTEARLEELTLKCEEERAK